MELKGTVAIVTGGNGGLGRRICHALAGEGSRVAVVYAASRAEAEEVASDLKAGGADAEAMQCAVTEPSQVSALASSALKRFGRIDILINDAAYNKWIAFDDLEGMTLDEWTRMMDVNLTGPMLCIKAVAPAMKRQGLGRIVNISSVAGLSPSGSSIGTRYLRQG